MSAKSGARPKTSETEKCERRKEIDREQLRSLEKFFEGLCMCDKCLKTANCRKNPDYPHWFGKTSTAAKFIKRTLLDMVKSKDPNLREQCIRNFNTLVGNDHGGLSDIIHLSKISVDELSSCIERLSAANKDVATFLELFHMLLLCSWKTDYLSVEVIFRSKQWSASLPEVPKTPKLQTNEEEFAECLDQIRVYYAGMIRHILMTGLDPMKEKLLSVPGLNDRLLFIAHAFAGGNGDFPWVDCFLYNYCYAMEHMWLFADEYSKSRQAKKDFLYPDVGKITGQLEMPVTVIPRIPKNLSCDICGSKRFPKHQNKLWPVVYSWSRNDGCFPRKIVRVHVPRDEWPQHNVKLTRRSVGIVCKKECVIKCEGLMFPGMNRGREVEYVKMLDGLEVHNLARFIHHHFLQQEQKSGAVSNRLGDLQVTVPPYVMYENFDFVDRRFLPEKFQSAFSAESIEQQMWRHTLGGASVNDKGEVEIDQDGASATEELARGMLGKGPGPKKSLPTRVCRNWRSEVVGKKPGAPLFETDDNFDPVGVLELIMGSNEMRSPSFLIGINKSPERGQGSACKENDLRQHLFRALPKCEFYSEIVDLENLTSPSESILRPVDFVRGTAFAVRPSNYAGGEKAAKDYLQELEPGGANGILFAYEVNLAKKTCCGGFIYRTADDKFVGIMMDNMYDFFLSTFTFSDLTNDILAGYIDRGKSKSNNSIPHEYLRNLKSRLASNKGGPYYSRSDIDTTRELYVYNFLISVALRPSAMMCQYLGQPEQYIVIRKNKFTIRCNLKNWNGEPCQIVQMDEVHVDYPVYSVLEEFAKSLSSNVDSVKFKFKGSKGLGDFHIDDSAVARAVGLPRQDYGGNDYHFEATVEEEGGGYPTTIATNESRIIFKGNLYICKVTIVANKGEGGRQVVRHFVPRDYTLKKVVDHHKNFGLDRTKMVYSVMPWKSSQYAKDVVAMSVYPDDTFSWVINTLGIGCDRLFHLKVTNDAAEVTCGDVLCVINYDDYRQDRLSEKKEIMMHDLNQLKQRKKINRGGRGEAKKAIDKMGKFTDDLRSLWMTSEGEHFLGESSHKFVWRGELELIDFPESESTSVEVVISYPDSCDFTPYSDKEEPGDFLSVKEDTRLWGEVLGCVVNCGDNIENMEKITDLFDDIMADSVFLCVSFVRFSGSQAIQMLTIQSMATLISKKGKSFEQDDFMLHGVVPFSQNGEWSAAFLVDYYEHERTPMLAIPRNKKLGSKYLDQITMYSGCRISGENAQEALKQGVNYLGRVQTLWPMRPNEEAKEVSILLKSSTRTSASLVTDQHLEEGSSLMYCTSVLVEGQLVRNVLEYPRTLFDVDIDFCGKEDDVFDGERLKGLEVNLVLVNTENQGELTKPDLDRYLLLLRRDLKGKWSGYIPTPRTRQNLVKELVVHRRSGVFNLQVFQDLNAAVANTDTEGMSKGVLKKDIVQAEVREELRQGNATIEQPFKARVDEKRDDSDRPKRYISAEGTVVYLQMSQKGNAFSGYLIVDETCHERDSASYMHPSFVKFHMNQFWIDAKTTARQGGFTCEQLGLQGGTALIFHALRLQEKGALQYHATAVWKKHSKQFKHPAKQPKPIGLDEVAKETKRVFKELSVLNHDEIRSFFEGKSIPNTLLFDKLEDSDTDVEVEPVKEEGRKGRNRRKERKKKQKPEVKHQNTEGAAKEAAPAQPSRPMKLGDDKDWATIRKLLEKIKAKSDEMAKSNEGEDAMDKCGFCFEEDFDMMRCGRCGVFSYCSDKCARQNARNHDKECREARSESAWNTALRKTRARMGPVVLKAAEAGAARPVASRAMPKKKKKRPQKF